MSLLQRFDVLSLHPAMVAGPLGESIVGRAQRSGLIEVGVHDIRDQASDKHRTVDDSPYGGGAGMVMRVDVVARAIEAVRREGSRVVLTSAGGQRFDQTQARRLAGYPHLIVVCGHYEGIDARIEGLVDEQISLGDFVLTGGEIAALAVVDAVARLHPGVLGNDDSAVDESFSDGLLEYPQYTRPREWNGQEIPEVLVSGDHGKVAAWRLDQAKTRTKERRPDLWEKWVESHPEPLEKKRRRRRSVDGDGSDR